MDVLSIIAGLIGVILGSAISFFSTRWATNKQIKFADQQDINNRLDSEKKAINAALHSMSIELQENIDILTSEDVMFLLGTDAWNIYKGYIISFPIETQSTIIKAYNQVKRFNSYFDLLDKYRPSMGAPADVFMKINSDAGKQKKSTIEACNIAIDMLNKVETKRTPGL